MKRKIFSAVTIALLSCSLLQHAKAQQAIPAQGNPSDKMYTDFVNPPVAARPRVWWHWMGGNVAWTGAKADMDWMKRVGIAGLQAFHAGQGQSLATSVVENYYPYMSDGWKAAFAKSAAYADSLGLEFGTAGSPGWSETGGPWVKPEDGMKKMSFAITYVEGGKPFTGVLNQPPSTTGAFQTSNSGSGHQAAMGPEKPMLYKDQKVIAFQITKEEILPTPVITSSGGQVTAAAFSDGIFSKSGLSLPAAKEVNGISWVQFDYGKPITVRGLALSTTVRGPVVFKLESSKDGISWSDTGAKILSNPIVRTNAVDNATARYFRLVSVKQPPAPPAPWSRWGGQTPPPAEVIEISELALFGTATINSFETKAGFFGDRSAEGYFETPTGASTKAAIKTSKVLDLTVQLRQDGTLTWTPPAGQWVVLRIGYSLTGAQNRPASPEATGLEVDKLDTAAVKRYMDTYISMNRDATKGLLGKKGLHAMMFDSWESGYANWSPVLLDGFKKFRGYDPTPWLPALAGYTVESTDQSNKFLWDWRRTIQQLLKENHYEFLTRYLHNMGMIRYGEAHEAGPSTIGEGMEMKQSSDIPMGAMWMEHLPSEIEGMYFNDIQESASVAHIYGQNIAATESFTGGPAYGTVPWDLKTTADAILLAGSNRFVIHTSTHQPITKGPGVTLGVGQMFSRNETWAEQGKVWIDYLSRSAYMLQAGKAANDIAVFYGEESNMIGIYRSTFPNVPEGYRYDYVSADALLNKLSVKDGAITTATGMNYKAILFGKGTQEVTLPVLKKTLKMVQDGAVLIGTRPVGSPTLSDNAAEVKKILDTLWPGGAVTNVGKGKVFNSSETEAALKAINLDVDFTYSKPQPDSHLMFIHRSLPDGDVYFVANRVDRAETIETNFRVSGRKPELWDAATGLITQASYKIDGKHIIVTIPFERFGSVFVVFRGTTTTGSQTVTQPSLKPITTLSGSWQVSFQAERGAPASATFDKLMDFRDHADPGVKYFSGIATYSKEVQLPAQSSGNHLWIDLGEVNTLAEVWVNGKLAGTTWKPPYRVDISNVAVAGTNRIEIKAVSLWVNRLIGDAQPGVTNKVTLTTRAFYRADSPLKPSGLLGPVQILSNAQQ
jgi:hypothetical protein